MRELEVRNAVRSGPLKKYFSDSKSRVVDELALCLGEARIDIAVINGKLSGYEIKSESDNLSRLQKQIEVYERVFDELTLVVDRSHSEASLAMLPDYWGVLQVHRGKDRRVVLTSIRKPSAMDTQDPNALAQLLWKEEAIEVLTRITGSRVSLSRPRAWLWNQLATDLSTNQLKKEVREKLKQRTAWRV